MLLRLKRRIGEGHECKVSRSAYGIEPIHVGVQRERIVFSVGGAAA
ncbi:hypothetical protein [Photobacterium sanctipauli]|nr:hypothetical protein [Photobacterium sanctipauli]